MPLGPHFGSFLEPPGLCFGRSWASLGRLLAALGALLGALGPLLCALEALLERSLLHLVALERFWAAPGTLGRVPRASRDEFWDDLLPNQEQYNNLSVLDASSSRVFCFAYGQSDLKPQKCSRSVERNDKLSRKARKSYRKKLCRQKSLAKTTKMKLTVH